jgi:transposase-like protein
METDNKSNRTGSRSGRKPGVSDLETNDMRTRALQYSLQGYTHEEIAEKMGRSIETVRKWINPPLESEYERLEKQATQDLGDYYRRFWIWQTQADELDDEIEALEVAQANGEAVDERSLKVLRDQRDRAIAKADHWKPLVEKNILAVTRAQAKKHSQESGFELPPQITYDAEAKYEAIRSYRRAKPWLEGDPEPEPGTLEWQIREFERTHGKVKYPKEAL